MPGKLNAIPDALSRWAYPASQALADVSFHGSAADAAEMKDIIAHERAEERRLHGVQSQRREPQDPHAPLALNLFSGTGSVSRALESLGFQVHSLDVRSSCRPTFCVDVMKWDFHAIPPGTYDAIFASPPCEEFSSAKTTSRRDGGKGLRIVQRTLQAIEHLRPKFWALENPQSGILARHPIMRPYPYQDFDYCQFSNWGYSKRTRIWGCDQIAKIKGVLCDGKSCACMVRGEGGRLRHRQWLEGRGYQPSTAMKNRVPAALVAYLLESSPGSTAKGRASACTIALRNFSCEKNCEVAPVNARPRFEFSKQRREREEKERAEQRAPSPHPVKIEEGLEPLAEAADDPWNVLNIHDWRAEYASCPRWSADWEKANEEEGVTGRK